MCLEISIILVFVYFSQKLTPVYHRLVLRMNKIVSLLVVVGILGDFIVLIYNRPS